MNIERSCNNRGFFNKEDSWAGRSILVLKRQNVTTAAKKYAMARRLLEDDAWAAFDRAAALIQMGTRHACRAREEHADFVSLQQNIPSKEPFHVRFQ